MSQRRRRREGEEVGGGGRGDGVKGRTGEEGTQRGGDAETDE